MDNKNDYFWNFVWSVVFLGLVAILSAYLYSNNIDVNVSVFTFFILGLAIFRITWLFVYDHAMNFVRAYFNKFEKGPGKTISNILSCPWCTGVWMSLFVVAIYFIYPITRVFVLIMALAGLGTLINVLIRYNWKKIP